MLDFRPKLGGSHCGGLTGLSGAVGGDAGLGGAVAGKSGVGVGRQAWEAARLLSAALGGGVLRTSLLAALRTCLRASLLASLLATLLASLRTSLLGCSHGHHGEQGNHDEETHFFRFLDASAWLGENWDCCDTFSRRHAAFIRLPLLQVSHFPTQSSKSASKSPGKQLPLGWEYVTKDIKQQAWDSTSLEIPSPEPASCVVLELRWFAVCW